MSEPVTPSHAYWYFDDGRVEATFDRNDEYCFVVNTRPEPDDGWPTIACDCGKTWPLYGTGLWITGEHLPHHMTIPVPVKVYYFAPDGGSVEKILLLELEDK